VWIAANGIEEAMIEIQIAAIKMVNAGMRREDAVISPHCAAFVERGAA
jgi:hypothetical protein